MDVELGTVTLLAVDQVGSTDQLRELGDVEGRAVRAQLLDQLLDIVAHHHGTLVDTTGDGFLAHFRSVAQALAAGRDCMAAVAATNTRKGDAERCQLRAGIHTGDALVDSAGRLHGMAVVIAARLCAAADTGQVLVSAISRTLVGQRPEFTFADERSLELKGVGTPVSAAPLQWEPAGGTDLTGSGVPPVDDTFGFVGRHQEAATLRSAVEDATSGARQVVGLAGEPGVGKTRLAIEAMRHATARGAVAGVGICDVDLPEPYQPVADALAKVLAQLPAVVSGRLHAAHPLAAAVIARRDRPELPTGVVVERHRLFADFAELLTQAAEASPVCLLLDDLQWATTDTVALVRHLVRSTTGSPVALLFTYRDSEVTQQHPLSDFLADLHRLPGTAQVRLAGLSADDVVALAEFAAGHPLGDAELDLARRIHADSAGSPFFATELIRHLVESGKVLNVDGRWSVADPGVVADLPASVRDVILRRVTQLDDVTQGLLRTAAIIGFTFSARLLGVVSEHGELDTLDHLETALDAGLIEELGPDRFQFRHQLTRVSLYEQYSATRRALLHRRVGEALEALGGDGLAEELAYHWGEATSLADAARVARYCRLAGDQARARHAPDDARRLYERALLALQLAPGADPVERCDLLISLGQVQRGLGDGAARRTLETAVEQARDLGDHTRLATAVQAMLRPGSFFSDTGTEDRQLIALIEEVLPLTSGASRARLLAARAAERHWVEPPEVLEAESAEALALARAAGDPVALIEVLLGRCVALGGPDFTVERVDLAAEAVELARRLGSIEWEAMSLIAWSSARYELGDPGVLRELPRVDEVTEQVTDRCTLWIAGLFAACRQIQRDSASGEVSALAAYELGEASNQPDAFTALAVQLGDIFWHTERLDEIVDEYANAAHEREISALRSGYARVLLELGRVDEARVELEWLAERGFQAGRDMVWLGYMTDLGLVASQLSTAEEQRRIYRWLTPFAGRFSFSAWFVVMNGAVDWTLGRLAEALGDVEAAERHFRDALAMEVAFGHDVWVRRGERDLARILEVRRATGAGSGRSS